MTTFQIMAIASMGTFLVLTMLAAGTGRLGRVPALLWTLIWGTGIVAVLFPGWTTTIANSVGIHRGADLLLYIVVIIMTAGFFSMYLRLRQVRREFTLLVRKIAIMEGKAMTGEEEDGGNV